MSVDYDKLITFWLKNIPYFWGNFSDTENMANMANTLVSEKSFYRVYIFKNTKGIDENIITNFFDDTTTFTCPDYIKNYFNCMYRTNIIMKPHLQLKMNGSIVNIPQYYSKKIFTVENLYSYLGVPYPKNKIILGKYPIITKYNPSPKVSIRKYTPPPLRSSELPQEKYTKELIDVYLSIYPNISSNIYSKVVIPISNPRDIVPNTTKSILQNSLFVTLDARNGKIYSFDKKSIIKKSLSNDNVSYIFIPFIVTNIKYTHAKLLIIDKNREHIYIFDPFGKENIFPGIIEKHIRNIFIDLGLPNKFKLIKEEDFCPINSFQYFEESEILFSSSQRDIGGYCSVWVFWFIDFLTNHPNINYKKAHYLALNELSKSSKGFQHFIKSYHIRLSNESKKIIKNLGLRDIRDYESKNFKTKIRDYIYKIYQSEKHKID